MEIVYDEPSLREYFVRAVRVSEERPVLVDRFLEDAFEADVDAISDGKRVVIGAVSTKVPQLESKDELRRKIDQASRYVPAEHLSLSTQCGFSSHRSGSGLTPAQQDAKMRLVVETAAEVWRSS